VSKAFNLFVMICIDGEVLLEREVIEFILNNRTVTGVRAQNLKTKRVEEYTGKTIICNIDPQTAARSIGMKKFSSAVRKKLNYDYSPSNFMAYCVVKDLDLAAYGFGKWNIFHTGDRDLNVAFDRMYEQNDFSNPSFAITTPTLLTTASRDCPDDCQIVEFLLDGCEFVSALIWRCHFRLDSTSGSGDRHINFSMLVD
jgi:all-trans-retinol 13,14-reductase